MDATGAPLFHPAPAPSTSEVQAVVDEVQRRIERLLRRRGLLDEDGELTRSDDPDDDDGQRTMIGASVAGRVAIGVRAGRRPRALRGPTSASRQRQLPERCARAGWFNLHAGVRIAPHDREALQRLCRYVARPPLAHDRLTETPDGNLVWTFERAWEDGTTGQLLTPVELLARLSAIIPQPRRNLVNFHGVFAPAAALRKRIVPATAPPAERHPLLPASARVSSESRWLPWRDLLWRVFDVDGRACPGCGRPMVVHAVVQGVWATRRVLACLARPTAAPRLLPARAPPEHA